MKRKQWYKQPGYYAGALALFITTWGINVKIVDFSKLGETTQALAQQQVETQERVNDVERWIEVQQEANQLQREWQQRYYYRNDYNNQPRSESHYEDDYYRTDEGFF